MPNGENDFQSFQQDNYDVPNGLSQTVYLSSLYNDDEYGQSNNALANDSTTKQFFCRIKPFFDDIFKQIETNPDISDEVHDQFQHILNYTKEKILLKLWKIMNQVTTIPNPLLSTTVS